MWGAILGAGANLAGGLIGYSQQQKELDRQRKEAEKLATQAGKEKDQAEKSIQDYGVGPAARQAYMMSQQDQAGDIVKRHIEKQAAQGL